MYMKCRMRSQGGEHGLRHHDGFGFRWTAAYAAGHEVLMLLMPYTHMGQKNALPTISTRRSSTGNRSWGSADDSVLNRTTLLWEPRQQGKDIAYWPLAMALSNTRTR